jgi:outer membrane receptor protein involved in Fe transport
MFARLSIGSLAAVLVVPVLVTAPETGYSQEQQLEEIIVSVRRRDENLQEIPLSVSTIDKEQINRLGINSTEDAIKYSAGLSFDEGFGAQDTRIVIRGLSPTRGRSNVAILVDGVDFTGEAVGTAGGGILANQRLLDVERVEIVKGPQSALYGRSAFAGAIQYVTKAPSLEEAEGNINVQYGNGSGSDQYSVDAAYGGPITDSFGLRVNGTWYDEEGFYENDLLNTGVGGAEGYGVALSGLWDAGGIFSAKARVGYSHDEYEPQAQTRVLANTVVDIDRSRAVLNGETDSLSYTNGLGASLGEVYPECERSEFIPSGPDATTGDNRITSCISLPRTVYSGKVPDGDDLTIIQRNRPRVDALGNKIPDESYPGTDVDLVSGTLNLEWGFDAGSFTSLTGGAYLDSEQLFDSQIDALIPGVEYGSLPAVGDGYTFTLAPCGWADCSPTNQEVDFKNTTKLFSQELRWSSDLDGPINYTIGGLYWKERVNQQDNGDTVAPAVFRSDPSFINPLPGLPDPPLVTDINRFPPANDVLLNGIVEPSDGQQRRDTRSMSIYGVLEFDITDEWKLTTEARYVDEKLNLRGSGCDPIATEALTGRVSTEVAGVLTCDPLRFRGTSSVATADGGSLPDGTYTKAVFNSVDATFDNDFFAPKATLEWAMSDTQLWYASVAKGVKPGGISTITAGTFFNPDVNTFDDEELWAYELGSKSTLLDGGLLLNAAIYYQDYTDKQVGVTRFDTVTQIEVGSIENAGESEIYGLELEATWLINEYWTLAAAYAWTQSEYTDFEIESSSATNVARSLAAGGPGCKSLVFSDPGNEPDGNEESCVLDLSGNDVEDVPEHSLVTDLRFEAPINSTTSWYSSASFIYNSERYIDEWNAKELDSYWIMDFRAGLVQDTWELIFFVDNVFDDDTVKSAVDFGSIPDSTRQGLFPPSPPDSLVVSLPDPRVAGIRANYQF